MSDSRLEIIKCDNVDAACSSFICNEMYGQKYWIGNKYSGGLHTYEIYCRKCIEHLVLNIPPELLPDGVETENRLRAMLTAEYNEILYQKLAEMQVQAKADAERYVVSQLAERQSFKPVDPATFVVEDDTDKAEEISHRCLDCGKDFEKKDQLDVHKVRGCYWMPSVTTDSKPAAKPAAKKPAAKRPASKGKR